jgi:hypothetical protein
MSDVISKFDPTSQMASTLVSETFKLIDGQAKSVEQQNKLAAVFLAKFAGIMVYRALTLKAPESFKKEEIVKFVMNNFRNSKQSVQESIAAAFTGAMHTYSGQSIEYYCQIRPVPAALNKEPI